MWILATNYWYLQIDWLPIWINMVLALVGIVAAGIAVRTLFIIHRQLTASYDAERCWILVKRVGNPGKGLYNPQDHSYIPSMIFEFKVSGNTPARVTNAHFRLQLAPAKPGIVPPEPDLPPIPDYNVNSRARSSEISEEGRVLAPEDTFQIDLIIPHLTEDQWVKLRDGEEVVCAYGFIKYKDAFGKERETRTCYVYDFTWGGVIVDLNGKEIHPQGFYIGGPPEYNKET